jgi:hypothetical protein
MDQFIRAQQEGSYPGGKSYGYVGVTASGKNTAIIRQILMNKISV